MQSANKYFYTVCMFFFSVIVMAQSINRKQLVERHTIINTKFDSLSSLSVGNGGFAFTVDVTGLQVAPDVVGAAGSDR